MLGEIIVSYKIKTNKQMLILLLHILLEDQYSEMVYSSSYYWMQVLLIFKLWISFKSSLSSSCSCSFPGSPHPQHPTEAMVRVADITEALRPWEGARLPHCVSLFLKTPCMSPGLSRFKNPSPLCLQKTQ